MFWWYFIFFIFGGTLSEDVINCYIITKACICKGLICSFKHHGLNDKLDIEFNDKDWPGKPSSLALLFNKNTRQILLKWKGPNDSSIRDLRGYEIQFGVLTDFFRFVLNLQQNSPDDLFQYRKTEFGALCSFNLTEIGSVDVTINSLPRSTDFKENDCRCIHKAINFSKDESNLGDVHNKTIVSASNCPSTSSSRHNGTTAVIAGVVVALILTMAILSTVIVFVNRKNFLCGKTCHKDETSVQSIDTTESQTFILPTKKTTIIYMSERQQVIKAAEALSTYLSKYCKIEVTLAECSQQQFEDRRFGLNRYHSDFALVVYAGSSLLWHQEKEDSSNLCNGLQRRNSISHFSPSRIVLIKMSSAKESTLDWSCLPVFICPEQLQEMLFYLHGLNKSDFHNIDFPWPEMLSETIEGINLEKSFKELEQLDEKDLESFCPPSNLEPYDIDSNDLDEQMLQINCNYMGNNRYIDDSSCSDCKSLGGESV